MKVKLSIIIFTVILSVFFFQIISCKKNPEEPVYSIYRGTLQKVAKADPNIFKDIFEDDYYEFREYYEEGEPNNYKAYIIAMPSDMDKLKDYLSGPTPNPMFVTIKATYSNHYKYKQSAYEANNYLYIINNDKIANNLKNKLR